MKNSAIILAQSFEAAGHATLRAVGGLTER